MLKLLEMGLLGLGFQSSKAGTEQLKFHFATKIKGEDVVACLNFTDGELIDEKK